jgi:hypothetical protein
MTFKLPSPLPYLGSLIIAGLLAGLAHLVLQSQSIEGGVIALAVGLFIGHLVGVCTLPGAARATRAKPAAKAQAGTGDDIVSLYVGNLAYSAQRDALKELFEQYGTVHSVRIMTDRATRRPRGYGFVEMDHAGAQAAMQALNDSEFCGRTLRISEAKQRPSR